MAVVKPANSMYAFLSFLLAGAAIAGNADWRVDRLATSAPVTAVRQASELGLSAIADANNDGVLDLALPDASRTALQIVSARDGMIRSVATIPVGAKIGTAIGVLALQGRPIFLMGLEDGKAIAISQQKNSTPE
ncbi:hypothetical protein [Nitratireductor sp. GCM10026969]|uniref:hypothetical protein n=1 Tax=Nitratireductor sp. GCM10026969 TaxID=3252645 RepID=UPI0036162819